MAGRILVLLHDTDPFPRGDYFIWGLRDAWLEAGIDVAVAKGLASLPEADLVIPHLDLTVTPHEYRAVLDTLPNVANRGVYDISKQVVSSQLVDRNSAWDGPVIVKTNLNYGGEGELAVALRKTTAVGRFTSWVRSGVVRTLPLDSFIPGGRGYRIYPELAAVPAWVFADRTLVVERFLPEREGDMYFVRWYIFIGDRYRSMRVGAPHPVVNSRRMVTKAVGVPVPEAVHTFRRRWNLDFGKIDYVMHNGAPVILDVARTPGEQPPPKRLPLCRPFVPGVLPLLARASGAQPPISFTDVDG